MITEDFCSFEVAKLLKEKGLNTNWIKGAKPTHQFAMKWLREVHHLTIDVFHFSGWRVNIKSIPDDYLKADYSYPELKPSETYEEAVEAALKYCLENLV